MMMKSEKYLLLVFCLILIVSIVSACGSQPQQPANNATGSTNENSNQGGQSGAPADSQNDQNTGDADGQKINLKFGTAGSGGTQYYVGAGIADVLNKHIPGMNATAQETRGGLENMRNMSNDLVDIAFTTTGTIYNKRDDKTIDKSKVMILMDTYPSVANVTVRADSKYHTLDDIFAGDVKNLRFGVGEPGSSVQDSSKMVLSLYNLTYDDIKAETISQAEMADKLKDKGIDVAYFGGGIPISSVSDVAASVGARVLEFPDKAIEAAKEKAPDYAAFIMPGGTYPGMDKDIQTLASGTTLLGSASLDEETAYNIVKTILEYTDEVTKIHQAAKDIKLETATNFRDFYEKMGYQFHPGAIKYFKEKGIW